MNADIPVLTDKELVVLNELAHTSKKIYSGALLSNTEKICKDKINKRFSERQTIEYLRMIGIVNKKPLDDGFEIKLTDRGIEVHEYYNYLKNKRV